MSYFTRLSFGCALVLAACSVVPPHGFPPSDEREVVVRYDLSQRDPPVVRIPASGPDLTVLWLEFEPAGARETFEGGARLLTLDGDELVIRCRYRAYARPANEAGQLELPAPAELFPGASSIETLWHRDGAPAALQLPAPQG